MKKMAGFLVLLCLTAGQSLAIEMGAMAPGFSVKSGADETLSLSEVQGKVAIIFYETKDVIEQNRPLKNALTNLFEKTPAVKASSVVVPIINCSSASAFTKGVWKNELKKHSAKENITIYGDWDGKMAADYDMKAKTSNVVVIDGNGVIRYSSAGTLSDDAIRTVTGLVTQLAGKKK